MACSGTLWFDAGSTLWLGGICKVLRKSYDAITKLLLTKFKLPFEITWSETDFFPDCDTNTEWPIIFFKDFASIPPLILHRYHLLKQSESGAHWFISKRFQVNYLWYHDINQSLPSSRNKKGCNVLPS